MWVESTWRETFFDLNPRANIVNELIYLDLESNCLTGKSLHEYLTAESTETWSIYQNKGQYIGTSVWHLSSTGLTRSAFTILSVVLSVLSAAATNRFGLENDILYSIS